MLNKNSATYLVLLSSMCALNAQNPAPSMPASAKATADKPTSAKPVIAPAPSKVQKVVTIGMQNVLAALEEGKDAVKALMAKQQEWEKKLKALQTTLGNKVNALQAKMKTAKPEALEREKEEIERMDREYKNTATEANTSLQKSQNSTLMGLQKKIKDSVEDLAKKHGWDLVFAEEAGVLYAGPAHKIDGIVVGAMNTEYKKSKPTAPATTSATKK